MVVNAEQAAIWTKVVAAISG